MTKATFNEMMNTRKADGSLRKSHTSILLALAKASAPLDLKNLSKSSKLGARTVQPAIQFCCAEGLAKEVSIEDAAKSFEISAKGRKIVGGGKSKPAAKTEKVEEPATA